MANTSIVTTTDEHNLHNDVRRLLEMIDPKKQRPVGVPYDSYSGYIVMIAKIPDIGPNYGSRPQSVQLFGKLPTDVKQELQTIQGRFQEVQSR